MWSKMFSIMLYLVNLCMTAYTHAVYTVIKVTHTFLTRQYFYIIKNIHIIFVIWYIIKDVFKYSFNLSFVTKETSQTEVLTANNFIRCVYRILPLLFFAGFFVRETQIPYVPARLLNRLLQ